MKMLSKQTVIVLSILVGVTLELGIYLLTGRREAWDAEQFWTLGLPIALLLSLGVGLLSRGRDWVWTLLVAPAQVMTMMVRSAEIGSLWPLTLVLSTIMSLPFLGAAFVGSLLRRKA